MTSWTRGIRRIVVGHRPMGKLRRREERRRRKVTSEKFSAVITIPPQCHTYVSPPHHRQPTVFVPGMNDRALLPLDSFPTGHCSPRDQMFATGYYELLTIPTTASATTLALHVISISYALHHPSILSVVNLEPDERTEGSAALGLGAWVSGGAKGDLVTAAEVTTGSKGTK